MNYAQEIWISRILNILTLGYLNYVTHGTHKQMSSVYSGSKKSIQIITFDELKEKFDGIPWVPMAEFRYSLSGFERYHNRGNQIHAGLFQLNNEYFLLTPIGLLRANKLVKLKWIELMKKENKFPLFVRTEP